MVENDHQRQKKILCLSTKMEKLFKWQMDIWVRDQQM